MNLLVYFLTVQTFAAIVSLVGAIVVVAVVIFLIKSTAVSEDKLSVKKRVYKVRTRYFFGLAALIIFALLFSLRLLPYPKFQSAPEVEVTVVAMQWTWKMGEGLSDKSPAAFTGNNEITLPANKVIKFIVKSMDVNHNFAIYNSSGVLVAQTQAMPEYSNELQFQFTQPGEYSILCLEYCGMPHGYMSGKIHVN